MNIIYLNGPYHKASYSRCSRSPAVTKSGTLYYPLWLAYAAGLAARDRIVRRAGGGRRLKVIRHIRVYTGHGISHMAVRQRRRRDAW